MSVITMIDYIQPYCPGWERSTGERNLLKLIEEGQDELINGDGDYMVWRDPSNDGWPPYLQTTAGTVEYEITAANLSCDTITRTIGGSARNVRCRLVTAIFIDVTESRYDYARRYLGTPYIRYGVNPYSTSRTKIYVSDVAVDSIPALESDNARVIFPEDPGTTTATFFVEFLWEAPRLDSENIPIVLPVRFEKALRLYAIGTVQQLANGKRNDFLSEFHSYWVPEAQRELTRGARLYQGETALRTA